MISFIVAAISLAMFGNAQESVRWSNNPNWRQYRLSFKECPIENGFCVLSNGGDQNSGVIKLDNSYGYENSGAQESCLARCLERPDATGCEVIWNQWNRGCYVHTDVVAKGNGVGRHMCWIFSRCNDAHPLHLECPIENGFCVLSNGGDQNSGVIKLDDSYGYENSGAQESCLARCLERPDATGCEVIWNQGNRGCYVHTDVVAKGNGVGRHMCWIFSRCNDAHPRHLLAGGWDASSDEVPFQVLIGYAEDGERRGHCGGSLIDTRWVLTAAHCLNNWPIIVDYGDIDKNNLKSVSAARIIKHPDFLEEKDDIALLELESEILDVTFAQLPAHDLSLNTGQQCWTSGWGAVGETDAGYSHLDILQVADLQIVRLKDCQKAYVEQRAPTSPGSKDMCARLQGRTSCKGDSGGPLFLKNSNGDKVIIGVTSRGDPECQGDILLPGIYTRVKHYVWWIMANKRYITVPVGLNCPGHYSQAYCPSFIEATNAFLSSIEGEGLTTVKACTVNYENTVRCLSRNEEYYCVPDGRAVCAIVLIR
jgi:hypothetical protein